MPIPSLKNVPGGGTDFKPCPIGTHSAVVTRLYYLGTQPSNDPKYKPAKKIVIVFEIDEPLEPGSDKNFMLSTTVGFSLNEKSGLTKLFKPVLGARWPKEGDNFDIETLLGLKCLVTVVHKQSGDKLYANVGSVGGLPRGMAPFETVTDEFCWSYDDAPRDGVPEWVKTAAAKCIELTGLNNASVPVSTPGAMSSRGHAVNPDADDSPF
jgi:hypothetical protein